MLPGCRQGPGHPPILCSPYTLESPAARKCHHLNWRVMAGISPSLMREHRLPIPSVHPMVTSSGRDVTERHTAIVSRVLRSRWGSSPLPSRGGGPRLSKYPHGRHSVSVTEEDVTDGTSAEEETTDDDPLPRNLHGHWSSKGRRQLPQFPVLFLFSLDALLLWHSTTLSGRGGLLHVIFRLSKVEGMEHLFSIPLHSCVHPFLHISSVISQVELWDIKSIST